MHGSSTEHGIYRYILSDEQEGTVRQSKETMLSTLLSKKLTPKEKEIQLSNEYGFETSTELKGGLKQMCNYSDLIEERGIKKGERLRLLTLIQKKLAKGKSLEQIADELEETVDAILPLYKQVRQELNAQQQ